MAQVRELSLRFDAGEQVDWPVLTVLIDGEDLIGRATGFIGFDPEDILGSSRALLPAEPPRRVAVYRCGCGESGCGCAACMITEQDGLITWSDFRDYTGVYARPITSPDPEEGGRRLSVEDLHFDADQYRQAVEQATNNRSWETRRRRVARLLRDRLIDETDHFAAMGLQIGWVAPTWNNDSSFTVELKMPNGQVVVDVQTDLRRSDEDAAEAMASDLVQSPEDRWHVLHRNEWQEGDEDPL